MSNVFNLIRPSSIKFAPDCTAIILNNRKITYGELSSLVDNTASYLLETGINENDIVPLLFNNSIEFIVYILSLWEIGAIPVPLNTKLLQRDLQEQISFLNSNLTIISEEFRNIPVPGKNLIISPDLSLQIDEFPNRKIQKLPIDHSRDRTALILFTSGSSGKPKAVMLSFENIIQSAMIGNKVLNQTKEDKWLLSLPIYHIGGFSIIFRALLFGASIVIPDSLSSNDLSKSIKKHKPTLASFVSNQLKKFVDINFIPSNELRTVILGGGFSDKDLILESIEQGWKIVKVYGSTETSSFVSFMDTEEVKKKPGASGKVIHPNKIRVTGEGEIIIQSPAVMKGYFKNEKETTNKLRDGFYYSGDIGYLDKEGYLFIEAKRDDLIISGGENINPVEVEKMILLHHNVKEVCVVGIENKEWGQIVSAAILLKENSRLSESELKDFLKDKLSFFKIPRQMIFINQLPKSELGKIPRGEVKRLFNS
jgi:O-succinylbenzoic acid--CoA ligase